MENLIIRPMQDSDIPEVSRLEEAAFSMPWSADAFREMLVREDALYLVAFREGKVLGVCGLHQSFESGEITNVSVAQDLRCSGIGTRLMAEILHAAVKRGISQVLLEVRVSNDAAVHLYEKCGFRVIGRRRDFYENPWEDAYVMECILPPEKS
ncbi:MAG: ribosomal protein S18-alanine N-acetyltransferase [Lachnospiraceae bacterium]|nr:ribosomal protein S18-alanine N-acetyltransferase [Lachnospiraceae bacterium]